MRLFSIALVLALSELGICQARIGAGSGQSGTPSAAANEPSLEETIKWLTDKLPQAKSAYTRVLKPPDRNKSSGEKYLTVEDVENSIIALQAKGCEVAILDRKTIEDRSPRLGLIQTETDQQSTKIPLNRVISVSLNEHKHGASPNGKMWVPKDGSTATYSPEVAFQISINADSSEFAQQFSEVRHTAGLPDSSDSDSATTDSYIFELDDGQLAPRLVKAMQHAVDLCKSLPVKPEPF